MYVPKNRGDLYAAMAVYIGYAPDLSTYRYFASHEDAEAQLYQAIDIVFTNPEVHTRMKEAADAAFLACREGREQDARDCFGIIIDELS
jgi:hypothetical protein